MSEDIEIDEECLSILPIVIAAGVGVFLLLFLFVYAVIFCNEIMYFFKNVNVRRKKRGLIF